MPIILNPVGDINSYQFHIPNLVLPCFWVLRSGPQNGLCEPVGRFASFKKTCHDLVTVCNCHWHRVLDMVEFQGFLHQPTAGEKFWCSNQTRWCGLNSPQLLVSVMFFFFFGLSFENQSSIGLRSSPLVSGGIPSAFSYAPAKLL